MGTPGRLLTVMTLVLVGVVCFAGCRQTGKFVGGVRARQRERALKARRPVFDSAPQQVEVAKGAAVTPTRAHPKGSAIPKVVTPTREHPKGSAIPKEVEPTAPTIDDKGVGQSPDNPYRNPGAEEWQKLRRHNGKLVKWRSADVRGHRIRIKCIPAPPVKSIVFHWGDGTHTKRMPSVSHTYARAGWYRVDIVIEDILGKHFRDGMTVKIEDISRGDAPQSGSGPAPQSGDSQQGVSGP